MLRQADPNPPPHGPVPPRAETGTPRADGTGDRNRSRKTAPVRADFNLGFSIGNMLTEVWISASITQAMSCQRLECVVGMLASGSTGTTPLMRRPFIS